MSVVVRLTGERHLVEMTMLDDPRVVRTACGELVARVGGPCDPTSAHQRAVYPPCDQRSDCPRCWS